MHAHMFFFMCHIVSVVVYVCLPDPSQSFNETQVQDRFEVLKKRKTLGSFTEQGKAMAFLFLKIRTIQLVCILCFSLSLPGIIEDQLFFHLRSLMDLELNFLGSHMSTW